MNKLKMHSPNIVQDNLQRIRQLFPGCVTEALGANGELRLAIDFDQLRQELADSVVDGAQERYLLTWPGKREALLTANAPIAKTLRPSRDESVDFDSTRNLFIEGDNLDALKLLQETYLGKIKLVYIDPPYHTGKDFIYKDDFSSDVGDYLQQSSQTDSEGGRLVANTEANGRFHSDWLSMIYPRLKLARNLLREDGAILISIVSVRSTHLECELRSGHRPHDWRIVETMEQISNEGRPRRREYSKDFKAEVLAKCRQPGASVGGVALAHGLHSNMVHRWIREAGAAYRAPLGMPGSQIAQAMQPRFTPVPLDLLSPAVPQAPAGSADQTAPTAPRPVELQLRRGDLIVSVQCPIEHCGTLLREVLR